MTMYVITHKEFHYPLPQGYRPVLVGADFNANPAHYTTDNTGENISAKNKSYCELTGLYWMWKNTTDPTVGISHYRRYFSKYQTRKQLGLNVLLGGHARPATVEYLDGLLDTPTTWIVSQPENGGASTLGAAFAKHHYQRDMNTTRQVVKELYPEYLTGFDQVMASERGSFYNMFYTSRAQLNAYCEWLFKVLFAVEKRTDISSYDTYQQRLYGFLGERLLNVWLTATKASVKYLAEYQTNVMGRRFVLKQFIKKF